MVSQTQTGDVVRWNGHVLMATGSWGDWGRRFVVLIPRWDTNRRRGQFLNLTPSTPIGGF